MSSNKLIPTSYLRSIIVMKIGGVPQEVLVLKINRTSLRLIKLGEGEQSFRSNLSRVVMARADGLPVFVRSHFSIDREVRLAPSPE